MDRNQERPGGGVAAADGQAVKGAARERAEPGVRLPRAELAIGGGAIIGVTGRWLISTFTQQHLPSSFPLATLAINLLGCLLIGVCQTLFLELTTARRELHLFVVVGLLGGFTTFSTFSAETVQLIQAGRLGLALVYQALSLSGGLGAALLGRSLAYAAYRRRA